MPIRLQGIILAARSLRSTLFSEPLRLLRERFAPRLAQRERQLSTVLSNIPQGVCLFDSSQRLVVCNESYLKMYNLSPDVVRPGCTLRELIDHRQAAGLLVENPSDYIRMILEHNSQGKALTFDARLPNGRCVKTVSQPLPDGGWVTIHEDITEHRQASEEALHAHARLRDAIDILPHGLVFLDAEGRYVLWNQQYADIYKRSADLFKPGARLRDTLRAGVMRGDYPEAIGREEEWIADRLSKLDNPQGRHEQTLADGRCVLIEERRTSDGGIIGLRVDITEMKQREESFRLLFDGNPVPMFVYDRENELILAVNDSAVQHYGYTRTRLLGMTLRHIHDGQSYEELKSLGGLLSNQQAGRTWKHLKSDGERIDVAIFAREITHEKIPAGLIAAIDITERKRAEARIAHMAHHDALTGLPNRVLLQRRMEEALVGARRDGKRVAALCIDLDNFKSVNDTLGHACGDLLLQRVAERIQRVVREVDTAARLGGDEFAILQANVANPIEVEALARRFLIEIAEPFDIMGHQLSINASVGVALTSDDSNDFERLLERADMALYRAKADGRGTFRFFEPEMDARAQARRQMEMDLRQAMLAGDIQVHYQPLVRIADSEISGFEALVRWRHPERGFIPPGDFIPIAEETGLITALGEYVLRKACADASKWPSPIKLAVNLSPLQFRTGNLFLTVKHALDQSGFPPNRLELEITETLLLDKVDQVLVTLHALRALGVRIAMDDFGTGYSSLSYLRKFPFDKIKIDRSFVSDVQSNTEAQAIVHAIVSLGSCLGMTITAEGIETDAELDFLKATICDEGQGYLFSKAMPQVEILKLLAKQAQRAA